MAIGSFGLRLSHVAIVSAGTVTAAVYLSSAQRSHTLRYCPGYSIMEFPYVSFEILLVAECQNIFATRVRTQKWWSMRLFVLGSINLGGKADAQCIQHT